MTADEFKAWRAQVGLSVREAAEALGVSRSTVEVYELGHRKDDGRPVVISRHIGLACAALAYGLDEWRPLPPTEETKDSDHG